jgi:hypothetical protein
MNYKNFLDKVFENLAGAGIDITGLQVDHIAFQPKPGMNTSPSWRS